MASISPITGLLTARAATLPAMTAAARQASQAAAPNGTQATQNTTPTTAATTQPLDLVFDSLALDSAIDDTLFMTPDAEASGTYAVFMGELFAALAQQTDAAQAAAQANASATTTATTAQPTTAAAEFASNTPSPTPNSALESDVQALANQVQAANSGASGSTATTTSSTSAATATIGTLSPLQQSFDQFIATAGGAAATANLPTFLQTLANNLHTVPSPLGNLVDSVT